MPEGDSMAARHATKHHYFASPHLILRFATKPLMGEALRFRPSYADSASAIFSFFQASAAFFHRLFLMRFTTIYSMLALTMKPLFRNSYRDALYITLGSRNALQRSRLSRHVALLLPPRLYIRS